jgi:L-aminopeptidase/D-esterase-like protein
LRVLITWLLFFCDKVIKSIFELILLKKTMKHEYSITAIPGIKVGQVTNERALTGCTVVLCEKGAVGGVDQRGGAPGTRETDLLQSRKLVDTVHAVLLAGGSAFGLDAAAGVMRYLEERGIGFNAGVAKVPIVPAAILFDLGIGDSKIRPDAEMGYLACKSASKQPPAEGNAGAGTGCTVGKILGPGRMMKSGIGSAVTEIGKGVYVGAIMAVNAFGDVKNPATGEIIAGVRSDQKALIRIGAPTYFADTMKIMKTFVGRTALRFAGRGNTTIGVVATNAKLSKTEANVVAQMAHDGIARTIKPAHTRLDGDTIFTMATGKKRVDVNIVGAFAAEMVAQAILNGVKAAKSVGETPGFLQ